METQTQMKMEITFPEPTGARVDASIQNGEYTYLVKTDQPPEAGGDASAPTPFALFLASIGTCAGIYILSFCRQRNIPTENIRLVQRMERDPETGMVSLVKVDVYLPPEFPQRYVQAAIRTAGLCTVKKHLANPPQIVIEPHQGV